MFTTTVCISIIYFIVKIAELKLSSGLNKPVKYIFKETLVVAFSTIVALFIEQQFPQQFVSSSSMSPKVFTEDPNF